MLDFQTATGQIGALTAGVKRKAPPEKPTIGALFSSDEINYLIFRYLNENGFSHTAYLFGVESNVYNAQIDATQVPKGALIKILQKGVFFAEAELYSVLGNDSAEKFEAVNGTISLLESANPPCPKKTRPAVDQKALANAMKALRPVSRKGQQVKAVSSVVYDGQKKQMDRSMVELESAGNEGFLYAMRNRNQLKVVRDKEKEREKETKEQERRERLVQATSPCQLPNGVQPPPHHKTKVEKVHRKAHSETPPSTSNPAPPQPGQMMPVPQPPPPQTLPPPQSAQQATPQQQQQQQQQQAQPTTTAAIQHVSALQQPQQQPPPQQQQPQQPQQQQQPQPSSSAAIHQHVMTPSHILKELPQHTLNQAASMVQHGVPPHATSSSIGVALPNQMGSMITNYMNMPPLNMNMLMMMKDTDQAFLQKYMQNGGNSQHHQSGNSTIAQQLQLLQLHNLAGAPASHMFAVDMDNNDTYEVAFSPRHNGVCVIGHAFGAVKLFHLPIATPIHGWTLADLRARCITLRANDRVTDEELMKHELKNKAPVPTSWNPQGTMFVVGTYTGNARVFSAEGQLLHDILVGVNQAIRVAVFSPNGERLLTVQATKSQPNVIVWDVTSARRLQAINIEKVLDSAWYSDEIYAVNTGTIVRVYKISDPNPVRIIQHSQEINMLRFDKTSHLLAITGDDAMLQIWDLTKEGPLYAFQVHTRQVTHCIWSPCDGYLATGAFDNMLKVWNLKNGQLIIGHDLKEAPFAISFSPNGRLIAASTFESRILVFDVHTKNLIFCTQLPTGTGNYYLIDWSSGGDHFVVCGRRSMVFFEIKHPPLKSLIDDLDDKKVVTVG